MKDYKVFKVDTGETEWWVAPNKEQVIDGMDALYGIDSEDAESLEFVELSDDEISNLKVRDLNRKGEPLVLATEIIKKEFATSKTPMPFQLASTGY